VSIFGVVLRQITIAKVASRIVSECKGVNHSLGFAGKAESVFDGFSGALNRDWSACHKAVVDLDSHQEPFFAVDQSVHRRTGR